MTASPNSPNDLIARLMGTPSGRRALALASPAFFDTHYCGMRKAPHRTQWLLRTRNAIDFARQRRGPRKQLGKSRLLMLAPRDHGKTEAAITIAVAEICRQRDIRILWVSESQQVAQKRVKRIISLLNSAKIVEDWASSPEEGFGPFDGPDAKWTQTEVYVQRSRTSVDPTIEAVGAGGSLTGGHYDLILCDDLETDKTTLTQARRSKTQAWFKGTVTPMLSPGGSIIIIGTRKHHDDLYGHLIKKKGWRIVEDPAIKVWPESYEFTSHYDPIEDMDVVDSVEVKGAYEVLWPTERPIEYLLKEREEMSHLMFAREMQHQVQDDSAAPFLMKWLEVAQERGSHLSLGEIPEGIRRLEVVQGWDFSLVTDSKRAEKQDSDWTVGTTWARDMDTGDRYLLGIKRIRGISPGRIRAEVDAEFRKFNSQHRVSAISVEKNSFGELHFMGLQASTDLPVTPHQTGTNKRDPWKGVPALRALFANGKVVFPSKTDEDRAEVGVLISELWGLGRELHDDTVMSLWIAETVLRTGGFTYRVGGGAGIAETGAELEPDEEDDDDYDGFDAGAELWSTLGGSFDFDDDD